MKKQKIKKLNKAGYTLVELIIVIAIMAVFIAMSSIAFVAVKNRSPEKYSKMVNEMISDFYKNATTKEGEWKMVIGKENDKTYTFAQYYKINDTDGWQQYSTVSIDGNVVYAVNKIEIDNCDVKMYKNGTEITDLPASIYVSRERAVFDASSQIDTIVFIRGTATGYVNIVPGTPNNYTGKKK